MDRFAFGPPVKQAKQTILQYVGGLEILIRPVLFVTSLRSGSCDVSNYIWTKCM